MTEIGPATENEMALAFLQAEIDSPRYGERYLSILSSINLTRGSIVDAPDM
jgi:hypothetical protein